MNVSMWMTREVLTVGPETPVVEAARIMAEKKVRRLLVAEKRTDGLHLLGIASAKDVIHAFPPHVNPFAIVAPDPRQTPTKVSEIMTASPLTTTPETPIETAASLMCARKIGALPVLRGHILAGIITESDIFRAFTSLFPHDEKGVRITFDATQGEDIFGLLAGFCQRHELKISSLIWTVHDELPVCVVRASGAGVEKMLEELWNSGHAVVNVIRFEEAEDKRVFTPVPVPLKSRSSASKDDSDSELYPST
jgi:acetoin utilization protein AcuB